MEKVPCQFCGKSCIPKLWHYAPLFSSLSTIPVRYMKTQHLCPYCGGVMYESGGGLTFLGKLLIFFMIIPLPIMYAIDNHDFPLGAYIVYSIIVAPLLWRRSLLRLLESFIKT